VPLVKLSEARSAGRSVAERRSASADKVLRGLSESYSVEKDYDIFLSHSFSDAELILGVWQLFSSRGYSVYVDWIVDPVLDRSNVTKSTALKLRQRMRSCRCLLYASSEYSSNSRWMPWELGYFDGFKSNKVAVLPLVESSQTEDYRGQEYLGLYPYVSLAEIAGKSSEGLVFWVNDSSSVYVGFDAWMKGGKQPYRRSD
jgi:hypothetical protein